MPELHKHQGLNEFWACRLISVNLMGQFEGDLPKHSQTGIILAFRRQTHIQKKQELSCWYSAWCGTCATSIILFLGLWWPLLNSNLQKQDICTEHLLPQRCNGQKQVLKSENEISERAALPYFYHKTRKTFTSVKPMLKIFLYHGWVLPLLPLYFSPEQVESNSAFDGFIRMKISTLSRIKSIWDREKRKVKMMLFPSFILLDSAKQKYEASLISTFIQDNWISLRKAKW